MKIKVSDYIADFFAKNEITDVFTVTGGGAMHLNDSFGHHPKLHCTYQHHEQACAMAAEGYTRLSGKTSILCVTTGPGGTNALTGVMGSWLDSIPVFVISGQEKYITTIKSSDVPLRQLGFQEFNIIDCAKTMTKYATMVIDKNSISYELEKALYIARSGRTGPVWLDIPLDVQAASVETDELIHFTPKENKIGIESSDIDFVLSKIKKSKRPVILAGNGIRLGNAVTDFRELVEKLRIPVVTAWNAHDILPDSNKYFCGRPGTIGTRGGNFVVQNADLLLSIGCRMGLRQIGFAWEQFAKNAYKIAVDIDYAELNKKTVKNDKKIVCNSKDFINACLNADYSTGAQHSEWLDWCTNINKKYPVVQSEYYKKQSPVNPYVFFKKLSNHIDENDVTIASNGTACVCALQVIELKNNQRMFTNAGASSMGYGLPAAIGAAIYHKDEGHIICLEGDGSIQMNLQELQTVIHNKFDIKIFWLNNNGYQSIRFSQTGYFKAKERGYCGVDAESGLSFPSAKKIANAYGIKYYKIDSHKDLDKNLKKIMVDKKPCICEVVLDINQQFAPKSSSKILPDGKMISAPLEDMAPFLPEEELASNMIANK